jgi:hypothetical protein
VSKKTSPLRTLKTKIRFGLLEIKIQVSFPTFFIIVDVSVAVTLPMSQKWRIFDVIEQNAKSGRHALES